MSSRTIWCDEFRRFYGRDLPDDYLVFDLETTGLESDALPTEIGHVIVRGRQIVHQGAFYLNWPQDPRVDQGWLRNRLEQVQRDFWRRGQPFYIDYELLLTQGQPVARVLDFYHELFTHNREAGALFLGHNAWRFDAPRLGLTFERFRELRWYFWSGELLDTGLLTKALMLSLLPRSGEQLEKYYRRVLNRRAGPSWSLKACCQYYGLVDKYGLDEAQLHGAGYDCYVTHLVFEALRDRLDGKCLPEALAQASCG